MKHFGTTVTWIANPPINTVHVEHFASNNGQKELIHYTSLKEKTPGYDEFQHVVGSSEGHGYGMQGENLALDRVKSLIEGNKWRRFSVHNK